MRHVEFKQSGNISLRTGSILYKSGCIIVHCCVCFDWFFLFCFFVYFFIFPLNNNTTIEWCMHPTFQFWWPPLFTVVTFLMSLRQFFEILRLMFSILPWTLYVLFNIIGLLFYYFHSQIDVYSHANVWTTKIHGM